MASVQQVGWCTVGKWSRWKLISWKVIPSPSMITPPNQEVRAQRLSGVTGRCTCRWRELPAKSASRRRCRRRGGGRIASGLCRAATGFHLGCEMWVGLSSPSLRFWATSEALVRPVSTARVGRTRERTHGGHEIVSSRVRGDGQAAATIGRSTNFGRETRARPRESERDQRRYPQEMRALYLDLRKQSTLSPLSLLLHNLVHVSEKHTHTHARTHARARAHTHTHTLRAHLGPKEKAQ